tara:strand:+ start:779 stop:1771 length:993 start_codon:yes stop_codon:yes gene_type:complete
MGERRVHMMKDNIKNARMSPRDRRKWSPDRNVSPPSTRQISPDRFQDEVVDRHATCEELTKLDDDMVSSKVNHYCRIFKDILKKCTMKKNGLDMYYESLTRWNNAIQTSVIFFSAASTFIQSLAEQSDHPEKDKNITIMTLSISTYSGIILSVSKYLKFDETKENVHNLRDRFAELHSRIKYYRDLISPWGNINHYQNYNEKDKAKEWTNLITMVDREYSNIIETKKDLFTSYEKIIDSRVARKYDIKFLNREVIYLGKKGRSQEVLDELDNTYNINMRDPGMGIVSERRTIQPLRGDNKQEKESCCGRWCFKNKNKNKNDFLEEEDEMY